MVSTVKSSTFRVYGLLNPTITDMETNCFITTPVRWFPPTGQAEVAEFTETYLKG